MSQQPNKKNASPGGREALGKGIRSLLQNIDADLKGSGSAVGEKVVQAAAGTERIPLDQISVNQHQPRRDFDEQALRELAESIRVHDVIQPITVRHTGSRKYQLISGERRLRAAKLAGLRDIPVYIRQANDEQMLELALLENLQREDLNAIEVALSFQRLMEECSLTQEQAAERMSKDRSTVTNYLRLLKLPPDIQAAVRSGALSMGHARALSGLQAVEQQLYAFAEIRRLQLSVRQAEQLVQRLAGAQKKRPAAGGAQLPPVYRQAQDRLSSYFSTRVSLQRKKNGSGQIAIEFYSDEELHHILDLIERQR